MQDFKRLILLQKRTQPILQQFVDYTLSSDKFNWQYTNEACFKELSYDEFIRENLYGSCNYSIFYNADYSQALFIVGRVEDDDNEEGLYTKSTIRWSINDESLDLPQEKIISTLKKQSAQIYHIISVNSLRFPSTGKKDFEFRITDTKKYEQHLFDKRKELRLKQVNQLVYKKIIIEIWEQFEHICNIHNFSRILYHIISNTKFAYKYLSEIISVKVTCRDYEDDNQYYVYSIRNELKFTNRYGEKQIDKYLGVDSMSNKNIIIPGIDKNNEEYCFLMIISQFYALFTPAYRNKNDYYDMLNYSNRITFAIDDVYKQLVTTGNFEIK